MTIPFDDTLVAKRDAVKAALNGLQVPLFGLVAFDTHLNIRGRRVTRASTVRPFPYATVFHGPVGKGVSESAFIECSDGQTYIVKFHSSRPNYKFPRNTTNELLCERLGRALALPIPSARS